MKKAFLKKIIIAVIVVTTVSTLTPLGVSAEWKKSYDNNWYYVQENQEVKGWKKIDNRWYNFDSTGKMNTGWIYDNGIWYWCDSSSGIMKIGWIKDKGKWYYCDNSGAMKTGWIRDNCKWYYCDNSGVMHTGVIKVNDKIYCLNNSGVMQTGDVILNNKTYTCSLNGQVIATKLPICDKEFDSNNRIIKSNNQTSIIRAVTTTSSDSNASINVTTAQVDGLPELPQNYSVDIQNSAENKVLELMNQKRAEAGLKPVTIDNTLLQVARYKSNHMIQYNYFDHTNPDGTKWTAWLKKIGYYYTTTGENIVYNNYDPNDFFNLWWNSLPHRENMMNPSFTKVGIGIVHNKDNNQYFGTQTFSN